MIRITKTYKTLKLAERYQNRLYNKYNSVQLVSFPRFSEEGQYVWMCGGRKISVA
jgi:hypothetical protein